ncbi:MAG: hypothetical protein KF732_12665, partial [Flavobacteriales bacterium]|nr:hypothetical protein [Flavobacteriales bacterium]
MKIKIILITIGLLALNLQSFSQLNNCGANALTVNSSCVTTAYNVATAFTNSIASPSCATSYRDGWYTFTATSTSTTITVTNNRDAGIAVYTGGCGTLTEVGCVNAGGNSVTETLVQTTVIGTTYYVRIMRVNNANANDMTGNICVYNTPIPAGCTPNTTIASIPYVQTGFNTSGSGDDFSSSNACGSSYMNGDDYVFTYTPSANECVNIALTNTSTYVGVFVTNGCPSMGGVSCVASNTNSAGNPSISSVSLTAGVTYFITVSTWPSPQTTPFDISI